MLTVTVLTISYGQQRAVLPIELKDLSLKVDHVQPILSGPDVPAFKGPNSYTSVLKDGITLDENIIGETFYDLQSNALLSDRIYVFQDGTIGAVWTLGLESSSFPDRGTGYNLYDGTAWGGAPGERIETFRAGWPSYAPWGENGEIIVSHDFSAFDLYFNSRPQKGTGDWTQILFEYTNGPTQLAWPRMTTSGEDHNTIHLLASTYGAYLGQTVGVVYSRSLDGGATWETENEVLDGMGSDYYLEINADQYIWANPVGNTIAFLVAGAWHDMFMMKSEDNGENWEKTVIWEHPYPFFDWNTTITDTFFCVDNSASIALDETGKAHVAFGINRVIHSEVGTSYNYFPFVDGIGYWNEDMETFSNDLSALAPPQYGYPSSEMVEDYNYIGWTQDVDGDGEITYITTSTGFPMAYREMGVSTMPAISVGPGGWVVVAFSSTTETYDNFEWNYKKLWMREKQPGSDWGEFVHLTADIVHIFDESIFAVAFPTFTDNVHILYNNDGSPGTALDGDHDYIENRITYANVMMYPNAVAEKPSGNNSSDQLIIAPNPFKDHVKVFFTLLNENEVVLTLTDLTGKEVVKQSLGIKDAGEYLQTFNLSYLDKGLYFVNLKHGNSMITKKVVKY